MSKKSLIITISIVLGLLLLSLIGYYFIILGNKSGTDPGTTGFRSFFPFGGNATTEQATSTRPVQPETPKPNNFTQKLRKLSTEPVAGAGVLDIKAGSLVRYVERGTGHVFEVEMFSPNQNRISNVTTPITYEALWENKNNSFIARYLEDDNRTIDTYSISVKTSTSTASSISGVTFPPSISDVSVFGGNVFYLQQKSLGSAGYVSGFDGSKKKQVWNSPIKELLSQFVNTKTVALTSKPAQNISGFLYFVDTETGKVTNVLGNIVGLTTLTSADTTKVLYLAQGDGISTYIFDIKAKSYTGIVPTTFPEKCVWSNKDKNIVYCAVPKERLDEKSLTTWYKGLIAFTDDIWKYDLKTNTSTLIENPLNEFGEIIDVIKPILSENEQYLIFINKRDNILWSLDLTK